MTPSEMNAAVLANLPARTGKTLEEWLEVVKVMGPMKRSELVKRLKTDYALGHVTATILAQYQEGSAHVQLDSQELRKSLLNGASPEATVVFEEISGFAQGLEGVESNPCKGYIGFRTARRQFAVMRIRKSRVELGLVLPADLGDRRELIPVCDHKPFGGGNVNLAFWADEHEWQAAIRLAWELNR